jgi:transcriptional regulator with XRE-family HTH domain
MTGFDGRALREWRSRNGYSQAELALELGVSRQSIVNWEKAEVIDRVVGLALVALERVPSERKIGGTMGQRTRQLR